MSYLETTITPIVEILATRVLIYVWAGKDSPCNQEDNQEQQLIAKFQSSVYYDWHVCPSSIRPDDKRLYQHHSNSQHTDENVPIFLSFNMVNFPPNSWLLRFWVMFTVASTSTSFENVCDVVRQETKVEGMFSEDPYGWIVWAKLQHVFLKVLIFDRM